MEYIRLAVQIVSLILFILGAVFAHHNTGKGMKQVKIFMIIMAITRFVGMIMMFYLSYGNANMSLFVRYASFWNLIDFILKVIAFVMLGIFVVKYQPASKSDYYEYE